MIEHDRRSSQMVWFGSTWHETIGEFLWYLERPSRREMGCRGCKFEHQNPQVAFCILSAQVCCCYPAKKAMIITATCWHQYCSGTICRQLFWTRVTSLFRWPTRWYWYLKDLDCLMFHFLFTTFNSSDYCTFFPSCRHVLSTSVRALAGWWLLHLQLGSYRWARWPSCHSRSQRWIFKSCGLIWCRFDSAKCGFDQRVESAKAHVAFGVNASQYYVESEWGRHCRSDPFDTFSRRKAAGNTTVASYASFGPNHQYYIEFPDWIYWKIDDAEIERLVKEKKPVKFVSFGPQGAVVLVLQSGAYYFRDLAFDWAVRDSTS